MERKGTMKKAPKKNDVKENPLEPQTPRKRRGPEARRSTSTLLPGSDVPVTVRPFVKSAKTEVIDEGREGG